MGNLALTMTIQSAKTVEDRGRVMAPPPIEDHSTVAQKMMQVLARQLRHAQVQAAPGKPQGEVLSDIYDKLA
jgi:hypothetical protein